MYYQLKWNLLYRKIRFKRKYKLKKNYSLLGIEKVNIIYGEWRVIKSERKRKLYYYKDESIITLVNWNKELFDKCCKYQEEKQQLIKELEILRCENERLKRGLEILWKNGDIKL